jgi:hypothetical protein
MTVVNPVLTTPAVTLLAPPQTVCHGVLLTDARVRKSIPSKLGGAVD